ncbi:replication factor C subunit 4 [Coelomomyces lativittatus]|nr:replication factor C subunit 4 [Coelomomyces lativittatus]KAJ1512822.1 replication factor C subunit 4 [Coelomomyces lativittatus]KAJ1515087.1 replication factor C subunit 4 [Coelomomyces lativittatus]
MASNLISQAMDFDTHLPSTQNELELPWVEKYRPITLDEVVGNEETLVRLKVIADQGNMPNLILTGSPGIGKTTSIMCLANALLGSAVKEAVLELNASDDRGIDVVRNRIKMFSQKKVSLPPGRHKIVILDEADSMTAGAQQAMRRTMEIYSSTTRFALACNISSKLIEPIQSRCAILRFSVPSKDAMLKRLLHVSDRENLKIAPEAFEALLFVADGDLRLALNQLQAAAASSDWIDQDVIFKVCDQPHPYRLTQLLQACTKGEIDHALDILNQLWKEGYSALDILTTLFKLVKNAVNNPSSTSSTLFLSEYLQLEYAKCIGLTHLKMLEGMGSLLQLAGLLSKLCKLAHPPLDVSI